MPCFFLRKLYKVELINCLKRHDTACIVQISQATVQTVCSQDESIGIASTSPDVRQ
jgi:hypothetical protein